MIYNDYNSYLKNKFGCRVYRIGIDAGFSCPNRDPADGSGGCLYCDARGSRSGYADHSESIAGQISSRASYLRERYGAAKFIAYFQAFTNTYAPVNKLKSVYDNVIPFPEIVGISIGTRPDCVDRKKLELIASYRSRYDVWLELGLQSSHDRTLKSINRGHSFADFSGAARLAGEFGIPVTAHVILGLPGESRSDMMETAAKLSELGISGIKIHMLHVLKGSRLESLYRNGNLELMGQGDYVSTTCDFLERLSPDIVVQRITGEGPKDHHVAPEWALDKMGTIKMIKDEMRRRGSRQGAISSRR